MNGRVLIFGEIFFEFPAIIELLRQKATNITKFDIKYQTIRTWTISGEHGGAALT